VPLEAAVVVEALVDHRQRDHRIDQPVVPGDAHERGQDQRDAVTHRERRDELGDVAEFREEEDHPEEEQQVVVAGDHVLGAQHRVLQVAASEHGLLVGLRDAVRERQRRRQERGEQRRARTECHDDLKKAQGRQPGPRAMQSF
jgi:hypothetical protein